jgi:drug/metabolite transporter (DMT)-like permease
MSSSIDKKEGVHLEAAVQNRQSSHEYLDPEKDLSSLAKLAMVIVQTIAAGWNVLGSVALTTQEISPLTFALVRMVLATFFLSVVARWTSPGSRFVPEGRDCARVLCVGLSSGFIMPVAAIYGLQMTTPTTLAIYDGPLFPVCVFALTLCIGVERLSPRHACRQISGVLLAVSGALAVLLGTESTVNEANPGSSYVLGNSILVAESVALSVGLVLQKPLLTRYSIPHISMWTWAVGACATACFIGVQSGGLFSALAAFTGTVASSTTVLGAVVYLVLLHTSASFLLSGFANRTLPSSTVALFACLQPVLTALLEVAILNKTIAPQQVVGAALIACGLVLKELAGPAEPPTSDPAPCTCCKLRAASCRMPDASTGRRVGLEPGCSALGRLHT